MLPTLIRTLGAYAVDQVGYWLDCVSSVLTAAREEQPHAVAVYFHGVLQEPADGLVDPQERVTPDFLGEFIGAMKAAGYTFVTPDALLGPERPAGKLALLSSDDGYRSVELLLPVLEREAAPLAVFLTSAHSRTDAIYWWDQLYIAGQSRPATRSLLKHHVRTPDEREAALRHLGFDPDAAAFSDSHRLLAPVDITRLAGSPWFCFGNHTRSHFSLPLLPDAAVRDEVEGAQREIETWTGRPAHHFAFPYGDHDQRTLDLVRRCGCRTAFTTEPGRFPLPSDPGPSLTHVIPRYRLRGDRSARVQARIMSRGITAGARVRGRVARWVNAKLERLHG